MSAVLVESASILPRRSTVTKSQLSDSRIGNIDAHRGGSPLPASRDATGHPALDAVLPDRGWSRGVLTELLVRNPMTSVPVLAPALARLTRKGRRIAVVVPAHAAYANALAAAGVDRSRIVGIDRAGDQYWTTEQCLRDGSFGAVVTWQSPADYLQLRRWHVAATSSDALAFVLRPLDAFAETVTPATLRLAIRRDEDGCHIDIAKCRGRNGVALPSIRID